MRSYNKSYYKPENPDKYKGTLPIVCRSSWERRLCVFLDRHPGIMKWGSESIVIPYQSPVDYKMHKYYVDFIVMYRTKSGEIKRALVEVKPYSQTIPPKTTKNTKSNLDAWCTFEVNKAKWAAATKWCADRGLEFKIFTEYELGIKR